jgi:RNA polymerase sigma factor for flagellar operon FliA
MANQPDSSLPQGTALMHPDFRQPDFPQPELRQVDAQPGRSAAMPPTLAALGIPNFSPMPVELAGRRAKAAPEPLSAEQAAAEERLMIEHLPTVRYVARQIHERLPQHVEFEELISAGILGLIDAARKFDAGKNVQFRSYAQFRIRGAILDSLRSLDWSPRDLRRKGRAMEDAIRTLTAQMGRPPAEQEIAAKMGFTLGDYQQLLGELKGLEVSTLNAERSEESGEEELAFVPGREIDDPLYKCLEGEARERLTSAIENLAERERLVMTLYYYEEMTMKEIGLMLGVVESRVSQIHAAAVGHLRLMLADLGSKGRKPVPQQRARRMS